MRQGAGEVVYGAGKTAEQIAAIIKALRDAGQERILVTRLDAEKATRTSELLDNGIDLGYVPNAQLALVGGKPPLPVTDASLSPAPARATCPSPKKPR